MGFWHQRSYSSTVLKSGMQGPGGLFNDGLDLATCRNNGAVCPRGPDDICYAHHRITSGHRPRGPTIKSVHFPLNRHPSLMSFSSPSPGQAVVASGLGALYVAEGRSNKTHLQQAQVSLDATISSSLTHENILKESCDDANSGGSLCNKDQVRLLSPCLTRICSRVC